ncbi:phosphate/phosphite/phosphonate ABC transporter substrate-binding protein [Thiomicrorhabdus heinhorstiae]|uniref:Phosphate/phosphite/phosphonate ABC transporter substrate-binding protein n=1 Tax=Thiomicrorhabdus heinhorstiae TaxID=2748010 RepID=A0ABS0BVG2_9GAMM|nr:phosphate/phosphite/phosphonate ABC transporter substrate-binding protein [Thiomicrorhabdus heinhorstiae]MBF6057821.1 phosphate/phosphite/phosphonate ABC transporter substrate-binding protein [Thiomicrorhabdus heinhorstiae]
MFKQIVTWFALLLLLCLGACNEQTTAPQTNYNPTFYPERQVPQHEYRFAIHPLHNPERLFKVFNPLIEYLNRQIPEARFVLEASRDYPAFDDKLKSSSVDFALPNPYQTLLAIQHHYHVFAKMGDDYNFRGLILVRQDSGIRQPSDLIGKSISYPAPTALAATMLPQYFLKTHGLDVLNQADNRYVGSQESVIMNVLHGETDAGATWPIPWQSMVEERPQLKKELKVIWQTQTLPNNSVIAKDTVPAELVKKVQIALRQLHQSNEGKEILKAMQISCFEEASDRTYDKVAAFIQQFREQVRDPDKNG